MPWRLPCTSFSADYGRLRHGHLRTQLMKSADSIATNIAEGCGTDSNREFARFLDISIKSASETENHLISARDLELMSQENWLRYTTETIEIRRMTFAYR
jgi:four helix bundle protein